MGGMNGRERILSALAGKRPDKIPILLHNFLLAIKEAGMDHKQYRSDPRALAKAHSLAVEKYGYDGVLVDVSTAMLAAAVGVEVDYPDNQPARCHKPLLNGLDEVEDLEPVDVAQTPEIQTALEGVRLLAKHFGGQILIRGNCDQSPFSLASMIRSPEQWMMDLIEGPETHVHQLLEYCTNVTGQFLKLMADAGADVLSNGDSPAGPDMISPDMYRTYALPYEKRITALSRQLGKPYVLHICGNTSVILDDMVTSGADAIELDYKTDMQHAHDATLKRGVGFLGNIDPSGVIALGTVQDVKTKTRQLLEKFADHPRFILNAGCAIPAETPPENLKAMIEVARNFR